MNLNMQREKSQENGLMSDNKVKPINETYSIDVELRDILEVKRLGNLKRFKPSLKRKGLTPYEKFYKKVAKLIDIPLKQIDVSTVVVSMATANKLNEYLYEYAKAHTHYSGRALQNCLAMEHLNYGPVASGSKHIKDGYVYIRMLNRGTTNEST